MQVKDAISVIKERLNIVDLISHYVELKQNGSRFVAPCPFHQETKPSFYVDPEKGYFYCFGCQAAGDVFEFYSKINGLEFKECLEELADKIGIEVEYNKKYPDNANYDKSEKTLHAKTAGLRREILAMHEAASEFYALQLKNSQGEQCRKYLHERGLSQEIINKFQLGWACDEWSALAEYLKKRNFNLNLAVQAGLAGVSKSGSFYDRFRGRLMFPIKNLIGQTIAFGGRIIEDKDEAKYINSSDTPIYKKKDNLYGLFQARRHISHSGYVLLTEGYMDVLALHQFGYTTGVGALGTSFTEEQLTRISGFTSNVFLVFDGDEPGRKAAFRAAEMFLVKGLSCNVIILPPKDDIDSLLRTSGNFDQYLENAKEGLVFCISILKNWAIRDTINWVRNFVKNITTPEMQSYYVSKLAYNLRIPEEELRKGISELTANHHKAKTHELTDLSENFFDIGEQQILTFAVRYPERLNELVEMGAHFCLKSSRSKDLWELLEKWSPEEVFYYLNEDQKKFWLAQNDPQKAPRNDGDFELACLKKNINKYYSRKQANSLNEALRESDKLGDFASALEYLAAIQENMEK